MNITVESLIRPSIRILVGVALAVTTPLAFKIPAGFSGNPQVSLPYGSSASKVKMIAPGFMDPGPGQGKILNGVNLLTGQPHYSITLGAIAARTVQFPISLSYSGSTKSTVELDNDRAPVSWVGLGFNMSFPFVAVNHKGTTTSHDDVFFCNLGPYGGGQLLLDSAGLRFYVASNPYVKIDFDTATSGEYLGQYTKWTFTFQDGKKMMFGQDTNAQRYVCYNKGVIKASPYTYVSAQKFIYRWDVRTFYDTIPNLPPKNILTFEYERFTDLGASAKPYVREGYLRNIKWVENNIEVERYEFKTSPKSSNEYVDYTTYEPREDQKLFETRRLDSLKCYKEGVLTHFLKFYGRTRAKGSLSNVQMGLLDSIRAFYPKPLSNQFIQDGGWTFAYDSTKFQLLTSVTTPSMRKDIYEYTFADFTGTDGDQDPTNYIMRRADHTSEISLPADTAALSKWTVESTCDERFCYAVVRDRDDLELEGESGIKQKMYVEIKRNLGNHFDPRSTENGEIITARIEVGNSTTPADKWRFYPAGNYVLVVGEQSGIIKMLEYDGVRWIESQWNDLADGGAIKVFPAANYFLVQTVGTPSKIRVVTRKNHVWQCINNNPSQCEFSNKGAYGESIRDTETGACLEWTRNSLVVSPMSNLFTVLDSATGVFTAYGLDKQGARFTEVSAKFGFSPTHSGLQMAGKPMNWQYSINAVQPAGDYFLVHSSTSSTNHYFHGFYFDGDTLTQIVAKNSSRPMATFTSQDYLVHLDDQNINFCKRTLDYPQYGFNSCTTIRNDFIKPDWKLLVRTNPSAFTLEYYPDTAEIEHRPVVSEDGIYQTFFYHVHPSYPSGYREKTDSLKVDGKRLFNISFSGSDNMLVATKGVSSGGACNMDIHIGGCNISYYTFRFHPEDTANFIRGEWDRRFITTNGDWKPIKQQHESMSNAARLGMRVVLDSTGGSRRIRYRLYQFDGMGFGLPDDHYVVSSVISHSSLVDEYRNKIHHEFFYAPYSSTITEFNSSMQVPQYEAVDVVQVKGDYSDLGTNRTFFNLDSYTTPLNGKSLFLHGTEKYSRMMTAGGDTTIAMKSTTDIYRNPVWPQSLYQNRARASFAQHVASNQSRMSDTTYYINYCDANGAPRFVLSVSRPQKILLNQSIFDSLGFTRQTMSYKLPIFPDTMFMRTWNPLQPHSYSEVLRASKAVFEGYYFQEDSLWREVDETFDDNNLKAGSIPNFKLNEGWFPSSKITIRDTANAFQVLEAKVVKSKLANGLSESYSSNFYEGLRMQPVGVVSNSKLSNCAILMGENGNAALAGNYLDHLGRWEKNQSTFSIVQAHTGRYSIRVVDREGPVTKLGLKDVKDVGFGYRVSAWIYSDTGTPVMSVIRRNSSGSNVDTHFGSPVDGVLIKKKWQRWEVSLSSSQLLQGGLFDGGNDSLLIQIGTGSPVGNSNKIVYVDDIVCAPQNSGFGLSAYDFRGIVTSTIDGSHVTNHHQLDFRGNVVGVRDDQLRMFTQGASHRMGEN